MSLVSQARHEIDAPRWTFSSENCGLAEVKHLASTPHPGPLPVRGGEGVAAEQRAENPFQEISRPVPLLRRNAGSHHPQISEPDN